jgi:hypothetical protein
MLYILTRTPTSYGNTSVYMQRTNNRTMILPNSQRELGELVVNCRGSDCSEEISIRFLDSVELTDVAAFGLQCPRCHRKWVYDKSSINNRAQIR